MRAPQVGHDRAARGWFRVLSGGQSSRAVLALALLVLPVAATAWATIPQGVSGRVTDSTGHPVADATVSPTDPLKMGTAPAFTDSGGRFHVGARGWPLNLNVAVEAPGFAPTRTSGGMVVLHRWTVVTGRAVDETGAPVPNASVTLVRPHQVWTGQAGVDGRFSLPTTGGSGRAWVAVPPSASMTSVLPSSMATSAVTKRRALLSMRSFSPLFSAK